MSRSGRRRDGEVGRVGYIGSQLKADRSKAGSTAGRRGSKALRDEPYRSFPIDMGISHHKLVLGTRVNRGRRTKGRGYLGSSKQRPGGRSFGTLRPKWWVARPLRRCFFGGRYPFLAGNPPDGAFRAE